VIGLSFQTDSFTARIAALQALKARIPEIVGEELVAQVKDLTALSKAPDGSQYVPLTEPYKKRKMKLGKPGIPDYRLSGSFIGSVGFRDGIIGVEDRFVPQGQGLAKLRTAFDVAPGTITIIEAKILQYYNTM